MKSKLIMLFVVGLVAGTTSCSTSSAEKTEETLATGETLANVEESSGEELFEKICTQCHRTAPPANKEEAQTMLAPPIMGVMFHVNDGVKADNPEEKREATIDFIVDYAHNPSADKSFCEKHAIERFGVMPSQKDNITKEELTLVANFLCDTYPSEDIDHEELQEQMGMDQNEEPANH